MLQPGVLLDRDGILNPDVGYPHRVEDAVLFPDAAPALRMLQQAGFSLAVVSNQSGVARGYFGADDLRAFNASLAEQLTAQDVAISVEQFFVCTHAPAEGCGCRKPRPGLIHQAADRLQLDLRRSILIGDRESDIQAGHGAGLRTVLVDRHGSAGPTSADWICRTLIEAATKITRDSSASTPMAHQIRGEFLESAGLRLSAAQIQRLWSLSASECHEVVGELVATGFLRRTSDGNFVRRA
jgi:D-glycero-D-manno-heptose 1,7-bisphosphate phosphatase